MAFFVVQRDADSGLSIPLPDSYPTREAAIAALSSATASGSLALTGEVFIADLGTAVPVLLMAVPSGPVAEEPVAEEIAPEPVAEEIEVIAEEPEPVAEEIAPEPVAEEPEPEPEPEPVAQIDEPEPGADAVEPEPALETAATLDEQAADEVYAGSTFLGDEQSLAAALKRAASSLEDEGIVAPASIESAPSDDEAEEESASTEWPWANVEAYTVEAGPEVEQDEVPTAADAAAVMQAGDTSEEQASESEAEAADDEQLLEEIVSLTEPSAEEPGDGEGLIIEEAADDSPYVEAPAAEVLEPLIIAGITDIESAAIEAPSKEPVVILEDPPIITSAPLAGEEAYVPRPVILGDYADVVVPGGDVKVESVAEPSIAPETDLVAIAAEPLTGYEAQGDLGFEEYTCQDCVYANTCPKVGEATPADCGSFQWRAE